VGVRSGAAVPVGNAYAASGPLGSTVAAMIPFRLDVGFRLSPRWTIGLQGGAALVLPATCPAGVRCSGTDLRMGATVTFDTLPYGRFDPWIGLGLGYEWLWLRHGDAADRFTFDARGPEVVEMTLGFDFRPEPRLRIGPVVSASVGRFDWIGID